MDDTVRIRCKRCNAVFRDKARRVQPGYSRQCASCEVVIFFEETSGDTNVQAALQEAKTVRKALLAEEAEMATQRSKILLRRRNADAPDPDNV